MPGKKYHWLNQVAHYVFFDAKTLEEQVVEKKHLRVGGIIDLIRQGSDSLAAVSDS